VEGSVMATGLELYDALKAATRALPRDGTFLINPNDALDLRKLTVGDLVSRGVDGEIAEAVSRDLLDGNVETFGRALGVHLEVKKRVPNLIPGEGLKRAAEIMKDDPQTLEEMLEEMDRIRHPERYAP
jgi:hypothetical protein